MDHVLLTPQEAGAVPHMLSLKDLWRQVEREDLKHRDPLPLQDHKPGAHHHSISSFLVQPRKEVSGIYKIT